MRVLAADMRSRYQNPDVVQLLNIASFLDPHFKTLGHLPCQSQDETVEKLKEVMLERCSTTSPEAPDSLARTTTPEFVGRK